MLFRRAGQLSVTITYKNRGFLAQEVHELLSAFGFTVLCRLKYLTNKVLVNKYE